jgi:HAD superfamily hydrolase (TIGR01450 family)
MHEIREITTEELITSYAALLLDAYGVLVDMTGPLSGAIEFIAKLKRIKKPYYILTNDASKLPATAAKVYQRFGLEIEPQQIITSGILLKNYFKKNHLAGARCVVLGPEDSIRYVAEAGGKVVSFTETFDVLVIADEGGFPFLEAVEAVLTTLFRRIDRQEKVRLVLPNPDLICPKAEGGFGLASGSIALVLEAALKLRYPDRIQWRFERLGKPHDAIFNEAVQRSGTRDMVMIGDQLETDICGANVFGIDSVLIGTGITKMDAAADLPEDLRPKYRLKNL